MIITRPVTQRGVVDPGLTLVPGHQTHSLAGQTSVQISLYNILPQTLTVIRLQVNHKLPKETISTVELNNSSIRYLEVLTVQVDLISQVHPQAPCHLCTDRD